MTSKLVKKQEKTIQYKNIDSEYGKIDLEINLRYDDSCNNGHNSFSITGDIYKAGKARIDRNLISCGCLHDDIKKYASKYAKYIKWHLCSSDKPLHYIANTLYWAKENNFDNAKSCAVWEDAKSLDEFTKKNLEDRLPALMQEFKLAMEELGFVY